MVTLWPNLKNSEQYYEEKKNFIEWDKIGTF